MGLYTKDFDLKQEGGPVEAGFAENPEMASLGMVNEPDAMPPQEGGNESVADDIVAEMKGMKRSWLGRIYRATLIDTPSYVVGLMIKRNWLKPADISVLN